MVIFFSGTGNSRFGARIIAQTLGDELCSLTDMLRDKTKGLHSEKPWVFITPTYAWRMPRFVDAWIRRTTFTGSTKAYFVMTAGGGVGSAGRWLQLLCKAKGWEYKGLGAVRMGENYLALFPVPTSEQGLRMAQTRRTRFEKFAHTIQEGGVIETDRSMTLMGWQSYVTNPFFYAFIVKDKGFWTTSACIHCGKCATACPLENITMAGGNPRWNGNCTHCMACITTCPVQAIEYKHATQGKPRYHLD